MASTIDVRTTIVHGIYKEQGRDGAEDYDIHVTGFDTEGHPVRPIFAVPLTAGVMRALNEKPQARLEDVSRTPGGRDAAVEDIKRLKQAHLDTQSRTPATFPSVNITSKDLADLKEGLLQKAREEAEAEATAKAKK